MKDLIKALENFNEAFDELNREWDKSQEMHELDAMEDYPFEYSFDELTLGVSGWVDGCIEELNELDGLKEFKADI